MVEKIVMTILLLITVGAFLARSRDLVGYIQLGQGDDRRPRNWGRKLKDLFVVYLGQRKIMQWTVPGVMHVMIFWGFLVLGSTIVEAFGAVYQEGFHIPLVGQWGPLGAAQDFFVAAVLLGILIAFMIRKIQRPGRFRGSHLKEADYILFAIIGIMVTILFTRGAEISLGHFPYDPR